MIKRYISLTKPGIVVGNLMTASAGFFLALGGHALPWGLFLSMLLALTAIIAGACVMNNIMDRDIDARMTRTQGRALVTKTIKISAAKIYGISLLVMGLTLILLISLLSAMCAFVGVFVYVLLYSYYLKRRSHFTVLVGSIAGAMPPLIGYFAVAPPDFTALLLMITLISWQTAHSYAILLYRLEDYIAAKLPVYPVVKGIPATKTQIIVFIGCYVLSSCMLLFNAGLWRMMLANLVMALAWLTSTLFNAAQGEHLWAKKVFLSSLVVIMVLSLSIIGASFSFKSVSGL